MHFCLFYLTLLNFEVEYDTLWICIGAFLMQEGCPTTYFSDILSGKN